VRSLKNPLQAWQACHLCKFQGNDEETTLKETKSDDKCAEPLNSMWTLLAQIHNKSNDVEMSDFFLIFFYLYTLNYYYYYNVNLRNWVLFLAKSCNRENVEWVSIKLVALQSDGSMLSWGVYLHLLLLKS